MRDQDIDSGYLEKISEQVMYFWNGEDECYIKSVPKSGFYVKFKGQKEYSVEGTTDMVLTAIMSGKVATKAEYQKY